jgi:hypothetical protein
MRAHSVRNAVPKPCAKKRAGSLGKAKGKVLFLRKGAATDQRLAGPTHLSGKSTLGLTTLLS